mgnify:FL=1
MFTVNKLKITGFKSFAHPTELLIENGVTGIVGPNGCGKSNIFEAFRWVMGESSSKSLRSGLMDDVIFNGTQSLPAKNFAEVSIELDDFTGKINNFPDLERKLIITRSLERGVGSFYKINNKDVRAKDISILFYDSGSGPRSSSIISQGNVDQLINFKPIERKIILEDAAGTSGLQARRHESELKLQSTEINLEKLEINLNNLIEQKKGLSRQARQADRYEQISESIKFFQSILIFSEWKSLTKIINESQNEISVNKNKLKVSLEISSQKKEMIDLAKSEISKDQNERDNLNKNLFETENQINNQKNKLESITNKKAEIEKFKNTITNDIDLEEKKSKELKIYIQSLEEKISKENEDINNKTKLQKLNIEEIKLKNELKRMEAMFVSEIQMTLGEEFRSDNLKEEKETLTKKRNQNEIDLNTAHKQSEELKKSLKSCENNLNDFEKKKENINKNIVGQKQLIQQISEKKIKLITELRKLDTNRDTDLKKLTQLQTEIKTLNELIGGINISKDSILNLIKIEKGFENCVYAALTYELDATLTGSPKKWVLAKQDQIKNIKNSLLNYVKAPTQLNLILSQIRVLNDSEDPIKIQKELTVGQILVDKNGSIWRWDGFISEDNSQKKNLIDSQLKLNMLAKQMNQYQEKVVVLDKKKNDFSKQEKNFDESISKEISKLENFEENLKLIEKKLISFREEKSLVSYNLEKSFEKLEELKKTNKEITVSLNSIQDKENILKKNETSKSKNEEEIFKKSIQELDTKIEENRNQVSSIKEIIMKDELNRTFIMNDIEKSKTGLMDTIDRIKVLSERQNKYLIEEKNLEILPEKLTNEINDLEGKYNHVKKQVELGKEKFEDSINKLKVLENDLSKIEVQRENQRNEITRLQGALDSNIEKEKELRSLIYQTSSKQPEEFNKDERILNSEIKGYDNITKHLDKLKFQRDQIGPVNLRAKIEEQELGKSIDELALEKDDLIQALEKLRIAINKINAEGKNRLIDAYSKVNKNFSDLFKKLFEGGEAKLELIKSEDPLETGLEIFARPPGKKLSNISLLSGGEKTLTAIALIFSIFLINPSPICILDEVDAALDDSNVERFCKILTELKKNTKTKFLIITHHKITMSSIDRVYGVTMAEKGISDIVSVDFKKSDFKEAV